MSNLNDDPQIEANRRGVRAVYPGPRELFMDIDSNAASLSMAEMLGVLSSNGIKVTITDDHPSKSGLPKRHVTLTMGRDVSPIERIALQACLGSDPKRELLSLLRIWINADRPATCFFEPADPVPAGLLSTDDAKF